MSARLNAAFAAVALYLDEHWLSPILAVACRCLGLQRIPPPIAPYPVGSPTHATDGVTMEQFQENAHRAWIVAVDRERGTAEPRVMGDLDLELPRCESWAASSSSSESSGGETALIAAGFPPGSRIARGAHPAVREEFRRQPPQTLRQVRDACTQSMVHYSALDGRHVAHPRFVPFAGFTGSVQTTLPYRQELFDNRPENLTFADADLQAASLRRRRGVEAAGSRTAG